MSIVSQVQTYIEDSFRPMIEVVLKISLEYIQDTSAQMGEEELIRLIGTDVLNAIRSRP